MHTTWRERMMPLIAQILAEYQDLELNGKRTALREARPYWVNQGWLLKVWRDECRIQLGLKPRTKRPSRRESGKGQKVLFE